MKKTFTVLLILVSFLLAAGGGVAYVVYTEKGSQWAARWFLDRTFKGGQITFETMTGSLGKEFTVKQVEIKNVEKLPSQSVVRVQELVVAHLFRGFGKTNVIIRNARLVLPDSDPVTLEGQYKNGLLDFSLFCKGLGVEQVKTIIETKSLNIPFTGGVSNIDLKISGPLAEAAVVGRFYIETFTYKDFTLIKSPGQVDLKFKRAKNFAPFGTVVLEEGKLSAKNTVVKMQKSTFFFDGDMKNPSFFIQGNSTIEDVTIDITLTGTKKKPDIKLTSDSGFSKERLLLMLATGKRWKSLDATADTNQISPDLARDFIDYFVFSGSGDKLADKYGIKDVFVTYEPNKKSIGGKKRITDNLDVGYEVNETADTNQQKTIQQKVSGDVKVTNKMSVGLEKELKPANADPSLSEKPEENKVLLKYKTKF